MESPQPIPIPTQSRGAQSSSRSRSSTKLDDVASLTSFNPFSEEDENDQSSYALVASLFTKVKDALSVPLSTVTINPNPVTTSASSAQNGIVTTDQRRPSMHYSSSNNSNKSNNDRPTSLTVNTANPAPPLVSLTPVSIEAPFLLESDRPIPSSASFYPPESVDGGGYAIPGFPIQDSDARSIRTTHSMKRSVSVSKVIRRIRGEGLSRDYWMDDALCKECYDCKSVFTAWRRKHHCRICGQIYCARCASNIIKAARFGHDGMIRICNLCLEKLAKVDDEDDDDRRSVSSSVTTSFPAHQLGDSRSFSRMPQSPFAASQLFGRSDSFSLYSIAETTKRPYSGSEESGWGSRPLTPGDDLRDDRQYSHATAVPFRRTLTEDEKFPAPLTDKFGQVQSPSGPRSKTPIEFPVTVPVSVDGSMSSVAFPVSSPDHNGFDSPGMPRSRHNSYADFDGATFIRSRVQSRLGEIEMGEPGWRLRRESTAYAQELNTISMFHLRVMLRQMLTAEIIPNIKEWEETLLKLALRIARETIFTAHPHRQGADMDVRRYVKIKKIPGGAPQDSEYVDGAVITKNVAHKQMSRNLRNPRVMLVTFPLEFHRIEGQYMHFRQIFPQEKEYLGNLATRIAALRPHVVLAEKSVSRLALEALASHKIAVARTVKPSAINFVARMTQGDVFSSMDKLALEPRLGHCARFRVQTFDHPLIPGRRKTYMRFEGCNREMGCTIILRGGDIGVLKKIKRVTRFLAFIVRNLRLETHLWKDFVITLPVLTKLATPLPTSQDPFIQDVPDLQTAPPPSDITSLRITPTPSIDHQSLDDPAIDLTMEDLLNEDAEQLRLSRRIQESLEHYQKTFISVSATLRFPGPYPIRRMKELDDELYRIKQDWEDDLVRREEKSHSGHQEETVTQAPTPIIHLASATADEQADVAAQIESLQIPSIPPTPNPGRGSLDSHPGYFDLPVLASSTLSNGTLMASPLPCTPLEPEEEPTPVKCVEEIALESRYSLVKYQHEEQRRIWEWYLRKNNDDFDVEKYQCITLWEYTLPIEGYGLVRACFPPTFRYITFYGENDYTIGQFVENAVMDTLVQFLDPKAVCDGKGCGLPTARHCKVYVHNETRLFVAVEQWDGQITGNAHYSSPDTIITWSACRECGSATPFIPVSPEMQRYSFAKFLELHFYPADVQLVQGAGCQHNIYRHHIRYFAIKGMTVRFQADPITLHEVVYPPMRIRVRPETQLAIKNSDFERLHKRNVGWYSLLIDDLKLINIDAATGDEQEDAALTARINWLILRAEREKNDVTRSINQIYKETPLTDTLALNQVRAKRQDLIVAWQQESDTLPKPCMPPFLDRTSRKPSAFGSVRAMWPRRYDTYDTHVPSSSVSEAEESGIVARRTTGESFASTSSTSEASEAEPVTGGLDLGAQSEAEVGPSTLSQLCADTRSPKSDHESDSTIGAASFEKPRIQDCPASVQDGEREYVPELKSDPFVIEAQPLEGVERASRMVSRLPRRPTRYPSVAELVKRYQDYIPPQGVQELTKTALAPGIPVSESEQEGAVTTSYRPRVRSKQHYLSKKSSTSDFEQGYAANAAPRYINYARRPQGQVAGSSRIPGPYLPASFDSRPSSRRSSPDKRPMYSRVHSDSTVRVGRLSPPSGRPQPAGPFMPRSNRIRSVSRATMKEKAPSVRSTASGNKSTLRRQTRSGTVVSMMRHFERINRETERANRRYAVIRGKRARPVTFERAKLQILDSIKDVIKDESESSDSSEADDEGDDEDEAPEMEQKAGSGAAPVAMQPTPDANPEDGPIQQAEVVTTQPPSTSAEVQQEIDTQIVTVPEEPKPLPFTPSIPPSPAIFPSQIAASPPDLELGTERNSILKALSGFWPQPLPPVRQLEAEDPLSDPEHIFRDSSMVVRTDEPTSVIALALNSQKYRDLLAKSSAEKRLAREPKLMDGVEAFPDDRSVAESASTWGVVNVDSGDGADPTEELRVPSSKLPWAISFESSGLTISCTILYPEQFDALRRTYDCEKSMVESLARCVKWDASGGKSGSAFLKTLDDRFIAKELSRAELQAMETFAPSYFDYMSSAVVANRPTLLAKIFGCYKITFKKTQKDRGNKSKSFQMNLLVMENLFYDRQFYKIYDLKGSTRNRHVADTNAVLLDENLVQTAHLTPFYLREHSKRILRGALYNDSKFLADLNVMDYSLVVGYDSKASELVVGIVDYIRTYTLDKKLENWVKDSGILGGTNKGEPTIVGPKQYRQRFLSAMERYFPLVPDRWMKQHDAPEEEGNNLLDLWPDW